MFCGSFQASATNLLLVSAYNHASHKDGIDVLRVASSCDNVACRVGEPDVGVREGFADCVCQLILNAQIFCKA